MKNIIPILLFAAMGLWFRTALDNGRPARAQAPRTQRTVQPVRFYVRCPQCRHFFGTTQQVVVIKTYEQVH